MLPSYVALVPLQEARSVPLERLRAVANALQTQVVGDFGPVWGVATVISAFERLEDLPAGYLPLVVTTSDLPLHRRGFHFTMGGLPFAVVRYDEDQDWTVAASHELLEMLCDPFAQRIAVGRSLADTKAHQLKSGGTAQGSRPDVIEGDGGAYTEQGLVNYIVEVCDPCESSTYKIHGVTVSDFVTPAYYDTRGASTGPYSFLGAVKSQLGVLQGGSISWRALLPQTLVYRAGTGDDDDTGTAAGATSDEGLDEVPPSKLTISRVLDGSSGISVASQRSPQRGASLGPDRHRHTTDVSWAAAGGSVRADLEALLHYLRYTTNHQPPSIDEIIAFLERITDEDHYKTFKSDPQSELGKLGLTVDAAKLADVPTRDRYTEVLKYLQQQKKVAGIFGPDLSGEDTALWLCMQIG